MDPSAKDSRRRAAQSSPKVTRRLGEALRKLWRPPVGRAHGLNMIGYARGGLGNGETMRRFAEAARRGGFPCALVDFAINLGERGVDRRLEDWIGADNPYAVNLFFVNADQMPSARRHFGPAFFAGRRNIGLWWWELEELPAAWRGAFDLVDEVWAGSRFVHDSLARHATKPVRHVRIPVEVPPGAACPRSRFRLPEDRFVFLFSFDFHSYACRKNPEGAISAFKRAFPAGDDRARLLIKSMNGHRAPEAMTRLNAAIGDDPRISLLDGFLDYETAMGLVGACDAYLSLHRAEGFGQGLAEAMYLGKPTVATAWSGNLEFMDESNSCLVKARMIPIGPGEYPYGEGHSWADPDIDHAAGLMRRLVDEPAWAADIGRAAAQTMRNRHSYIECLRSIRDALRAA